MIGKIIFDSKASAAPLILFILTILVVGALYSLFFLEIGFPALKSYIPSSDSKTFTMMGIYAIPLIVTVVGVISLIKAGQKRSLGGDR